MHKNISRVIEDYLFGGAKWTTNQKLWTSKIILQIHKSMVTFNLHNLSFTDYIQFSSILNICQSKIMDFTAPRCCFFQNKFPTCVHKACSGHNSIGSRCELRGTQAAIDDDWTFSTWPLAMSKWHKKVHTETACVSKKSSKKSWLTCLTTKKISTLQYSFLTPVGSVHERVSSGCVD